MRLDRYHFEFLFLIKLTEGYSLEIIHTFPRAVVLPSTRNFIKPPPPITYSYIRSHPRSFSSLKNFTEIFCGKGALYILGCILLDETKLLSLFNMEAIVYKAWVTRTRLSLLSGFRDIILKNRYSGDNRIEKQLRLWDLICT